MQLDVVHRPLAPDSLKELKGADANSVRMGHQQMRRNDMAREADGRIGNFCSNDAGYGDSFLEHADRYVSLTLAKIRRALNGWVAAYLALVERRATAWALSTLNERELKDLGVYRGQSLAQAGQRLK